MNRLFKGFWLAAAVALVCCAPLAHATDTYTVTLTGVGNGFVMGGVYVSPYQGVVQENGVTIYSGYIICDDFETESNLNDTWDVGVGTTDPLNGQEKFNSPGSTYWDSTKTAQQDYDAVSWLALALLHNMNNEVLADEYSYAIWSIFDKAAISHVTGVGALSSTDVTNAVTALITSAFNAGAYTGPTVNVYTPMINGRSQEFLSVSTPEASAAMILGVNLFGLVGLVWLFRRRIAVGAR